MMGITFDKFTDFVCSRYGVEREEAIKIDSFENLGFDSLTLYTIIGEVEKEFHVIIDTDDITEINTLSSMYRYVTKY